MGGWGGGGWGGRPLNALGTGHYLSSEEGGVGVADFEINKV